MKQTLRLNILIILITALINSFAVANTSNNDTIAGNSKNQEIKGTVFADGNPIDTGYVIRFSINNPTGSCFAIDTAYIGNDGKYSFTSFQQNYSIYIIKAYLSNTSIYFNNYIPSCYDSKYKWINALPVTPTTDGSTYDINLKSLTPYSFVGNSSINGSISFENNSNITPMANAEVILINQYNNEPIAITTTDNLGNYFFNNLSFNVYGIFVEINCKISYKTIVTLNYLNPIINGLNFRIDHNNVLTTNDNSFLHLDNNIYPNPFSDIINIEFELKEKEHIKIQLSDQFGRVQQTKEEEFDAGINKIQLNTRNFTKGIYFLQFTTSSNSVITKKIVKIF